MFRKIRKFFAPSTAKALKGFTKATAQLDRVAATERAEAEKLRVRTAKLHARSLDADTRASEADRLATKFKEFLA